MERSPSSGDPGGHSNGDNFVQTTSSSTGEAAETPAVTSASHQPRPASTPPIAIPLPPTTQPPTNTTASSAPGAVSSTPALSTTPELPQASSSRGSDAESTSFRCPSFSCPSVQRPESCSRCHRSCWRAVRSPSHDRFCFIVPSNLWLKLRLFAVFSLLLGMFLLIIFPLPDTIMFAIALMLLIVSGAFVVLDVMRGIISNYWLANCSTEEVTSEREMSGRSRTVEVTGNAGMDDYENPAFSDEDSPPDYDTAIATPQPPVTISTPPAHHRRPGTSHYRGHRPPDITIDLTGVQGTSSRDNASTPDLLHNPYYTPSSMTSSLTPTSMFSYDGPRSPPPTYDDVIKETNARRPVFQQRGEVERVDSQQGGGGQRGTGDQSDNQQAGGGQRSDTERSDNQLVDGQREREQQNGDNDEHRGGDRRDDQRRDDQQVANQRREDQQVANQRRDDQQVANQRREDQQVANQWREDQQVADQGTDDHQVANQQMDDRRVGDEPRDGQVTAHRHIEDSGEQDDHVFTEENDPNS